MIDHAIAEHDDLADRMSHAIGAAWPTVEAAIRAARAAASEAADGDIIQAAQTDEVLAAIERTAREWRVDESALTKALLERGPEMSAALATVEQQSERR